MSHHKKPKLSYKLILMTGSLGFVFILFFWMVIVVAEDKMEMISLQHWLESEANMYEQDYDREGNQKSLPNHYEFDMYFSTEQMPRWLTHYDTPGLYEHHLGPEDKHFLVRTMPSKEGLYYIVFKDDADDYLDAYESTLHLVTLVLGGIIVILMFVYGTYLVLQIATPLQKVLNKIRHMPPDQPDFPVDAKYQELAMIEQALCDSKIRIAHFFRREQEFSRFAAHEIRTPLMVLQGSAELLKELNLNAPLATKASNRILHACADISLLTDTFLLLGKEHMDDSYFQELNLMGVLSEQLRDISALFPDSGIHYTLDNKHSPTVKAPPSFVVVLINNLLKNAYSYAKSELSIQLHEEKLTIRNDIDPQNSQGGYGYGLVIIDRICDRLGWHTTKKVTASQYSVTLYFT
ncbi:HAMP domain-containing histidine kinase [Marinomonas sp. A79]|uniref:histidine kinase n=1 Tax=Marinomonas vulgaris TaxID=2823372 RepID=A0ABS5H9W6_9GAMM|nr:HAMP domain-containing sensor histidine kinase [Marinomonas vulgaris]MBR7888462.1 HAMP domain-containing histidine kinase [Marinomonas vulgaris]